MVDATPTGTNVRSTIATYSGGLDELRRAFAATSDAQVQALSPGDFSYNTGSLRCPRWEGTSRGVLDVKFLPDVDITCPDCLGYRYDPRASEIRLDTANSYRTLPELLSMTVADAAVSLTKLPPARAKLQTLIDLGSAISLALILIGGSPRSQMVRQPVNILIDNAVTTK